MHKRNRSKEEKINDALDKINNIEPVLRTKMYDELLHRDDLNKSCVKCMNYIFDSYKFRAYGSDTKDYWLQRGWSIEFAHAKAKLNSKTGYISAFSVEFWMNKINPKTNTYFTEDEAIFERNSRRPINKEYWMIKGFSEEESIKLSIDSKTKNNNNGVKNKKISAITSKRCVQYWILRGFSKEKAEEEVSNQQSTFSKEKCIEKYGSEEGILIWKKRQKKWQDTLEAKTDIEKQEINKKKSTKINYNTLWSGELNVPGLIYILKLEEGVFKIGISSRELSQRYTIRTSKKAVFCKKVENINLAFQIEQLLKRKYVNNIHKCSYERFGWTEIIHGIDCKQLINDIEMFLKTPDDTYNSFLKAFKNNDPIK